MKEMKESWVDIILLEKKNIFCLWYIVLILSKILMGMCNNDKYGLYLFVVVCWYIGDYVWYWIY